MIIWSGLGLGLGIWLASFFIRLIVVARGNVREGKVYGKYPTSLPCRTPVTHEIGCAARSRKMDLTRVRLRFTRLQ